MIIYKALVMFKFFKLHLNSFGMSFTSGNIYDKVCWD